MSTKTNRVERDRQLLIAAQEKGGVSLLGAYARLSGPGWIASAITLGGGSLASSLFLGVIAGYTLMWLQPFAMILGIIMLSAIGYVTLSSNERPFPAINNHVNPVLGWGWALAVAAANIIWCMPQFSLANSVLTQNLLPHVLEDGGVLVEWALANAGLTREQAIEDWTAAYEAGVITGPFIKAWICLNFNKVAISGVVLILCTMITWSYDRGGLGLRIYELVLKLVVAMIVLCFFGVVVRLSFSEQPLDWPAIWRGLVPDFTQFGRPADTFLPLLDAIGQKGDAAYDFWYDKIVNHQRDVMISAAATAVGINMTFMFPYTMLRKGWTKEFRGLAIFDLSTGMFIPYILATGCVVIAAASQFHTKAGEGFVVEEKNGKLVKFAVPDFESKEFNEFDDLKKKRIRAALGKYESLVGERSDKFKEVDVSTAEKRIAATLIKRDAMDLAASLSPLTGPFVANYVFGLGVLGMVLSTISILMLISGFVFAEIFACKPGGAAHRIGTLIAGFGGACWMIFWTGGKSQFFLAIVTSVFGFVLLPFAYVTFVFVLNSKSLLADERPKGIKRLLWNILTLIAASTASVGAVYMVWIKAKAVGVAAVVAFIVLAIMVGANRKNSAKQVVDAETDDQM